MLAIWLKAWPPPPGFSRALFENARFAPKLQPLKQEVVGDIGATLWVLMGTIGLVLLIACANVANLLLVRAESRQQELAIRAALGAGWGRIAREMLLESLTLGVLGGALGLALAYGALRLLVAKGPATLPRLSEIGIDPLVLGFTLVVSLLAGLLFGLIPALKYAGPHLAIDAARRRTHHEPRPGTASGAQHAGGGASGTGAGAADRLRPDDSDVPGFAERPAGIHASRASPTDAHFDSRHAGEGTRTGDAHGERHAGQAGGDSGRHLGRRWQAPLRSKESTIRTICSMRETRPIRRGRFLPIRRFRYLSPGFLKTDGTPLIAGRDFTWTDLYDKRHVAMVSENLAREMWGSPAAALGKRIRSGLNDAWREIVGVVANVYDKGVDQKAPAFAYWPAMMDNFELEALRVTRFGVFAIRTNRAGTESFLAEARQAIWSVDANLPVFLVRTLKDVYDQSMARTSFTLVLLAIAGAMALVLGVVGIYGVIAYAVTQRTREIGIRMALGAQPGGLQGMFVRQGLLLAGIGAVLGLVAAAGLTRLMSSLLFETTALDPPTYAVVSAFLIVAAALASYVPARRATAVDPVEALRTE